MRQSGLEIDNLKVEIYTGRLAMGIAAAEIVAKKISQLQRKQDVVNIIFAAAPSQNEFLAALISQEGIDWSKVNAFHMDEYIGLPGGHAALFSSFLERKLFEHLPFRSLNCISCNAKDVQVECDRYAELLAQRPPDIVCMGIGGNGHIAFNDPHVADFNDPLRVKIVDLDHECRMQQVNDGCFLQLNDVPAKAITLTVPALLAGKHIYCIVPGKNKAKAVDRTLNGPVTEQCPASVLRTHADAILFLDNDSSALIKP
jgi:glucosamine-6-phosphate deaminase